MAAALRTRTPWTKDQTDLAISLWVAGRDIAEIAAKTGTPVAEIMSRIADAAAQAGPDADAVAAAAAPVEPVVAAPVKAKPAAPKPNILKPTVLKPVAELRPAAAPKPIPAKPVVAAKAAPAPMAAVAPKAAAPKPAAPKAVAERPVETAAAAPKPEPRKPMPLPADVANDDMRLENTDEDAALPAIAAPVVGPIRTAARLLVAADGGEGVPFMKATAFECHFPLWADNEQASIEAKRVCGCRVLAGKSWCAHHLQAVFEPPRKPQPRVA